MSDQPVSQAHRGRGILLVNLGSPDSPSVKDVRRYLDEFLMDARVLDVPYLLRRLIVSLTILPFRPKKAAEAYRSIWWDEGSPLVVLSQRVQRLVQERMDVPVALGMRYGNPSIPDALKCLIFEPDTPIDRVLLVPLYPHYAMSTYETVVVATRKALAKLGSGVTLDVLPPFYDESHYIDALVASAKDDLTWDCDHLLFSCHGLPERHLRKSDPTGCHCLSSTDCCRTSSPAHDTCYRAQVLKTVAAFVRMAGIPDDKHSVAFQSRLGRDHWMKPSTEETIRTLASSGVKKLLVICPSFVSDCLETLEEIGIRGRRAFLEAGGEELRLIPCMNDHPEWIDTLVGYCS